MRFYLDEQLSPTIAEIARGLGLDVVSAQELGREGLPDEEQLALAAQEGRCVVTEDRGDYVRLSVQFFEAQRPHAGVLLLPQSIRNDQFSRIAHALEAAARRYAGRPTAYLVDFLR